MGYRDYVDSLKEKNGVAQSVHQENGNDFVGYRDYVDSLRAKAAEKENAVVKDKLTLIEDNIKHYENKIKELQGKVNNANKQSGSVRSLEVLNERAKTDFEYWDKLYKDELSVNNGAETHNSVFYYKQAREAFQTYSKYDGQLKTTQQAEKAAGDIKELEKMLSEEKEKLKAAQDARTAQTYFEKEDFTSQSKYNAEIGKNDDVYEYINNSDMIYNTKFDKVGYGNLSEDEKDIYNYKYHTEGRASANAFLQSIQDKIRYRYAEELFEGYKDNTLREIFFGIEAGFHQFTQGIESYWWGNTDTSSTQYLSGMIRDDLDDVGFKILGSSLGQIAYDSVTTTTNMLPSVLTSLAISVINPTAGAVAGSALLGVSAAGNAYSEAINSGYSVFEAYRYSTLVGASETGLQLLLGGIAKLGGKFSVSAVLSKVDNVFAKFALSSAAEGLEEGLQETLDPWFRSISGLDYEAPNIEDILYASLLGFLSGGTFESITLATDVMGKIKDHNAPNNYLKGAGALINQGLTMPEGTEVYNISKTLKDKTDSGKKISNKEATSLVKAIKEQAKEKYVTGATKSAERVFTKLGETADAGRLSGVIGKVLSGESVSANEMLMLQKSEHGDKVLGQLSAGMNALSKKLDGYIQNLSTPKSNTAVDEAEDSGYNETTNQNYEGGEINGSTNAEILAGRTVSATGRGNNSLRQQSENTGKICSFLGIREGASERVGKRRAGSEGWLSEEVDGTARFTLDNGTSFLGNLRALKLKDIDSVGRKISSELLARLQNTALKNEDGTILSLYHFTDVDFERFDRGDIGFHFGTLDSAKGREDDPQRLKRGSKQIYKEVYLNITNPVFINFDPIRWDAFSALHLLERQNVITVEEIENLKKRSGYHKGEYDSEASIALRKLLQSKGYDGILYTNGSEGVGSVSAIAFDPDQIITVAENGVLKEGCGVTEEDTGTPDNDSQGTSGITELSPANPKTDYVDDFVAQMAGVENLTNEQRQIRSIGRKLGWKVVFAPVTTPNGTRTDGKIIFSQNAIVIDPNSKKPIQFILKHELAHSLEQDIAAYSDFANAVMDSNAFKEYVKRQGFNSATEYNADIVQRYKDAGAEGFDGTQAEHKANCEMVANFVGDCLFGADTEITTKLLEGMNTPQRRSFVQWLKDFFAKIKEKLSRKHNRLTTEISKLEDKFLETLNAVEAKENTAPKDGVSYSFEGYAENGRGKYKANFPKGTPKSAKGKTVLNYIQNVWSKKPIKLKILENGKTRYIEAQFDPTYDETGNTYSDATKLMGGNRHGTAAEQRVTLDLADDYYQIASESTYNYSKDETGKNNPAHKDVLRWHYFVNDIYFAEYGSEDYTPYTVSINVKEKTDGNFVYSFSAEKQESDTPQTLHAAVNVGENSNANVQLSNNKLSQKEPVVKNNSMQENENYSISADISLKDVLTQVENGEITVDEAESLLSRNKTLTPYDIANLPKSSADTTGGTGKPKRVGNGNKQSKFYTSALGSDIITPEVKKEIEADTYIKNYQGTTNKKTLNMAAKELEEGGQARVNEFKGIKAERASAVDVAVGLILLEGYQRAGNLDGALEIAEKLREIGTAAGQTVQIFSIIGRYTPEMMQVYAQKELDKAYEALVKAKTQKWVDKRKDSFKLTEEDIEFIRRRTLQAAMLEDGTRQKAVLLAEICTRVQDKIPPEAGQSLRALQRISLLLNVRTNLRNVLGNANMAGVFIASDFFGSLLDKQLAKSTGIRTTGNFQLKGSGTAFMKGLAESYDDFKRGIRTKQDELNRYDVNHGGGKNFNEHHKKLKQLDEVAKALNKLDNFTSFCLEAGDRPFFEMWFQNSLNNQLRLNNVEIPTPAMIEIARKEALERTWQNNNTISRTMTRLKNAANKVHIPRTSYGFGDFVLKFVKTPANIGKAMVEFSPIGFAPAIANGIKFKDALDTGRLTPQMQKEFVRSMSNAFTGTVIYVLVAVLANAGLIELSGGGDDDKDVSNFEKYIVGVAPYSMKIFGVDVTYSWNQPMGTIFATVADIMDSKKDGMDTAWYEDAWNAFKAGATVFTEQSFLSSLYELFSAEDIATGIAEAVLSEPAAFIPQLSSQLASFTDPYARTTYENGQPIQSAINSIIYKIPGLRQTLPKRVDILGEDVENNQYLNPWNAFANPSTAYPESSGKVAEQIYELYKETGENSVMPRTAPNKLTIKGNSIVFTAEEKAEFQRNIGTRSVNILEVMFESEDYKALSSEEKSEAVSKVYEYAYAKAKCELDVYDYTILAAMEGEDRNGNPILDEDLYNRLDDKAKQILVDEYFLSKAERQCKDETDKLAELFIKKAKE